MIVASFNVFSTTSAASLIDGLEIRYWSILARISFLPLPGAGDLGSASFFAGAGLAGAATVVSIFGVVTESAISVFESLLLLHDTKRPNTIIIGMQRFIKNSLVDDASYNRKT